MVQRSGSILNMDNYISEEFGKADFVLLDKVTKEAFMANLKLRYLKGKVYSYIGDVVVSVNPYRNLVIYDKEYVDVSVCICKYIAMYYLENG